MLGSLRLAAGGLFLIFIGSLFTVSAQTAQDDKPFANYLENNLKADDAFRPQIVAKSAARPESDYFKANRDEASAEGESADADDETDEARRIYRPKRGDREYNFEVGIAPTDPTHYTGEKTYNTAGRKIGTLNFRVGRVLGVKKAIVFTYLFGFTPLIVARANEVRNKAFVSAAQTPNVTPTKRETTYGAGVAPANFRFTFFPNSRVKPFVQVGAGVLYFNKPIPIPESRRLQFTADYGGGFIAHLKNPKQFMLFGYKYYHISNANIGGKQWNPGYNASIFYVGFSFFK